MDSAVELFMKLSEDAKPGDQVETATRRLTRIFEGKAELEPDQEAALRALRSISTPKK